jgi:alpha-ketoglutarate-dependent taurine dioxygenase
MSMQFEPLSPGFGVEATGLDVARLSPEQFGEIEQAFFAAQVLVLRAQHLAPGQFLDFARRFGPPEPHVIDQFHHPEHADILILSNRRTAEGEPVGLADAGTYFHTDYSYLDMPARATTLYSIEIPSRGGDTLFANQYAAYDDLSEATKRRIDGLVGLHHYGNRDDLNERSRTVASVLSQEQKQKVTWVRHPIVRRHPVTGRKALYAISGTSFGIAGMDEAEALALLDELKQHATREKYQLRLKYGVGDVVIWDNASLLHSATLTDPNDPRTLWRITIKETRRNP